MNFGAQPGQLAISQPVNGQLKSVSIGDTIYGANAQDEVFKWENKWVTLPGRLVHVSAADDGTFVGTNAQQGIFRLVNGQWQQLPGLATVVATGGANHIWCVNNEQSIFQFNVMSNNWDKKPGLAVNVSVGADGYAVVLNAQQELFGWQNNQWVQIPGQLVDVSCGDFNNVIGTNAQGEVYKFDRAANKWNRVQSVQNVTKISTNAKGQVVVLDSSMNIFRSV